MLCDEVARRVVSPAQLERGVWHACVAPLRSCATECAGEDSGDEAVVAEASRHAGGASRALGDGSRLVHLSGLLLVRLPRTVLHPPLLVTCLTLSLPALLLLYAAAYVRGWACGGAAPLEFAAVVTSDTEGRRPTKSGDGCGGGAPSVVVIGNAPREVEVPLDAYGEESSAKLKAALDGSPRIRLSRSHVVRVGGHSESRHCPGAASPWVTRCATSSTAALDALGALAQASVAAQGVAQSVAPGREHRAPSKEASKDSSERASERVFGAGGGAREVQHHLASAGGAGGSSAAAADADGPPNVLPAGPVEWRPEDWLKQYQISCVSEVPDCEKFKVRNRYYLTPGHKLKGKKEMSGGRGYVLKTALLIRSHKKLDHVAARFPLPPKPAGVPPTLIINFQVNSTPRQHFVLLYDKVPALDEMVDPRNLDAYDKMERDIFRPGSQLGAERAKIIPYLHAGAPWALGLLVNNQCGQLSAALEVVQHNGGGYAELDLDLGAFKSSSVFTKVAQKLIGLVFPVLMRLTVDMAFLFQGDNEEELPERIFGSCRINRIDMLRDGGNFDM